MAIHNIYKASIQIELPDLNDIKTSMGKIEDAVKSSVSAIDKDFSELKTSIATTFDMSGRVQAEMSKTENIVARSTGRMKAMFDEVGFKPDQFGIDPGPRGGLSGTPIRGARELQRQTSNVFQGLETVDPAHVTQGLEQVAARVNSTVDSIIAVINKVAPSTKEAFEKMKEGGVKEAKEFYDIVVGNSIIPDLVDEVEDVFNSLPPKVRGKLKPLEDDFIELKKAAEEATADPDLFRNIEQGVARRIKDIGQTVRNITRDFEVFERGGAVDVGSLSGTGIGSSLDQLKGSDIINQLGADTDEFRRKISELESSLSRLPDKTTPATKEIQREFSETRSEVLNLTRTLEKIDTGQIDAASVDIDQLSERFKRATNDLASSSTRVTNLLTDQQKQITDGFESLEGQATISLKGVGSAFDRNLGGSRILAVREAFFGVSESTNNFGKVLDFFVNKLDDVGTTENKFAKRSADLANQIGNVADTMQIQLRQFASFAQSQGVSSNVLNIVKQQAVGVEDAYEAIRTSAISTGRVTNQQLARARNELEKFRKNAADLRRAGLLPPETAAFLDKVEKQMAEADNATRSLAVRLQQTAKAQQEFGTEAEQAGTRVRRFTGFIGKFTFELFDFRKTADDSAQSIETITKATQGLQLTIGKIISIGGLGALLGGLGVGAGGLAIISQMTDIGTKFTGTAGLIENESIRINNAVNSAFDSQNIISGAFFNNFGDSIEEVGQATQFAIQRFKDLDGVNEQVIQSAVENAFKLRDAYQIDVQDSIDAVRTLSNDYGADLQTSFDVLAKLSKEGVVGPDVIDSITEYSTQIKNAGGDLEDLLNLLETGFQGGGILGTDKALDLFKEFRVLLSEGSEEVIESLKKLNINTEDLFARLASGDLTEIDVFDFIIQELEKVGDRGSQFDIGKKIFGTLFEDLGQDAVLAMSTFARSIDEVGGATAELDAIYNTAGAQIEQQNRRIQFALLPVQNAFTELRATVLPLFANAVAFATPYIADFATKASQVVDALSAGDWAGARQIVVDNVVAIIETATSYLEQFVASGADFGVSYIVEIANGIIEGVSTYIVEALNFLGNTIAAFMQPGSPPEEGPLSTIDKWGKGLIDTFSASFKAEDFRFVNDALAPIKQAFIDQLGGEGFEPFKNLRGDLVTLVEEINRTGQINTELFDKINSGIGEGNDELKQYLKLQLELKKSQQNLIDVQDEVQAAERAGFVSEDLKKKLKDAEKQVDVAKENVDFQKEFLDFQKLSRDEFEKFGSAAAKAANAASLGAGQATAAVKSALDKQLEFLNSSYGQERQLLEDKLNAGAISYDEYLKELVKLEEKFIDTSFETGVLSGVDKHIEDLNRFKAELESLKPGKAGTSLADGIVEAFDVSKASKALSPEDIIPEITFADAGKLGGEAISVSIAQSIERSVPAIASRASTAIGASLRSAVTQVTSAIPPELAGPAGVIGKVLLGAAVGGIVAKVAGVSLAVLKFGAILARFSVIGLAVWALWANWESILPIIQTAIDSVAGAWSRFADEFGGAEQLSAQVEKFFSELQLWALEVGQNLYEWIFGVFSGESSVSLTNVFDTEADITFIRQFAGDVASGFVDAFGISSAWHSLFDPIKAAITDAFTQFLDTNLGQELVRFADFTRQNVAPSITVLTAAVIGLAAQFGTSIPILGNLIGLFGEWILPVTAVIGVIRNFDEIMITLGNTLAGFVRFLTGTAEVINGFFLLFDPERRNEGLAQLLQGFQDMGAGIGAVFINLGTGAGQIILATIETISSAIGNLLVLLGAPDAGQFFINLSDQMQGLIATWSDQSNRATEILFGLSDQIGTIFSLIVPKIVDFWSNFAKPAIEAFLNLDQIVFQKAFEIEQKLGEAFYNWISKFTWQDILTGATAALTPGVSGSLPFIVSTSLTDMITQASTIIPQFVSTVVDGITGIPQQIATKFNELKESGSNMGQQITDGLLNSLGPVGNFVRGQLQDGVDSPVEETTNNILGLFTGLADELVNNSIVPDMVTDIGAEYIRMDDETQATLQSMLQSMTLIMTRIALMWKMKLDQMKRDLDEWKRQTKEILDKVEQEFKDIREEIGKIKEALDKLPEAIEKVKTALEGMSTVDFTTLLDNFETMEIALENSAEWAKDIKDDLAAAAISAQKIADASTQATNDDFTGLSVNPGLPQDETKFTTPTLPTSAIVAQNQAQLANLVAAGVSEINNTSGGVVVNNELHFPSVTDRETAKDAADEFKKRMNEIILKGKIRGKRS